MYVTALLLQRYGYFLMFGFALAEFIGVPMALVPILLVAGAVSSAAGVIHPVGIVLSVTAGALVGETVWFVLAKWQGRRLVGFACGLGSNPAACVVRVRARIERTGARALIVGKFVPGMGGIVAVSAGMSSLSIFRFLALDAVALTLWAATYTVLGWLLGERVTPVVDWLDHHGSMVSGVVAVALVGSIAWRVVKARRHGHAARS